MFSYADIPTVAAFALRLASSQRQQADLLTPWSGVTAATMTCLVLLRSGVVPEDDPSDDPGLLSAPVSQPKLLSVLILVLLDILTL